MHWQYYFNESMFIFLTQWVDLLGQPLSQNLVLSKFSGVTPPPLTVTGFIFESYGRPKLEFEVKPLNNDCESLQVTQYVSIV